MALESDLTVSASGSLNLHRKNSPLNFPSVRLDVNVKKIKSISSPRIELKPIRPQTDAVRDTQ